MPAERMGMRDAREILWLKASSVSTHEIGRRLGLARSTVRETLKRAETAGLAWPLPEGMNDEALEAALYASRRSKRGHRRIAEPDWANVHRELKRRRVTLLILWDEYVAANPGGYSYSRFCELYRGLRENAVGDDAPDARRRRAAVRRLRRRRRAGRHRSAHRRNPYGADLRRRAGRVELHLRQGDLDAGAARLDRVRAFEAIGGVPELVVPDNAKTAIVKASFYDPQVNRTYAEMAAHYGTAILPARPRKPRDKIP